jgi:hypothetical protein
MCGSTGGSSQVQPTAAQNEQANISAQMYQYYMTNYKPLVDKYVAQETSPDVKATRERKMAGEINADVMKKVDPSKASSNPVENTKRMAGLANVRAGAEVIGQGAAKSREIATTQNIIGMGRGEQTQAAAGISQLAGRSLAEEIGTLQLEQQEQASTENAIGSVAGMVAAGALKYGGGKTLSSQETFDKYGV